MVTPASASLGLHALATTLQLDTRLMLGRMLLKHRTLLAALQGAELAVRVESAMVKQAWQSSVGIARLKGCWLQRLFEPDPARDVACLESI
jgi:hypothetical protein